jgi:transposase
MKADSCLPRRQGKLSAYMTNNAPTTTTAVAVLQPVNHHSPVQGKSAGRGLLKLALDVHLRQHVVAMQYDGSSPKPPQRFSPEAFLAWVTKQVAQGWQVVSCYEAGPFGYVLHRQLEALGVRNYVIAPRNWDDQHKRVKTDRTDALAMLNALDRYVAGNPRALAVVRVPTEGQERLRSESRIRESLKRDLKMTAQRGRGLALQYGFRLTGRWYGPRNWPKLKLPEWLRPLLTPLRQMALALHTQVEGLTRQIEEGSTGTRPKGLGALTQQELDREVCDWRRFHNRRQVGSYLGLCPGEHSSGPRQQQGPITKCGNRRLRHCLVEASLRLLCHQPGYRLCRKWRTEFLSSKTTGRRRKQIIVALARGFAVDWWRIRTGQTTFEKLGLLPQT